MTQLVYGLYSTRNEEIRYIGETSTLLNARLNGHINGALTGREKSVKTEWILEELEKGFEIKAIVIASNTRPHIDEQRIIDAFRLVKGEKLLNTVSGHWQSNRIKAGLVRAKAAGKLIGRPGLPLERTKEIEDMLNTGTSINKTARQLNCGVGTVHRIKVKMQKLAENSDD